MNGGWRNGWLALFLALASGLSVAATADVTATADAAEPQPPRRAVMIELHEMITPLSATLLQRQFERAIADGAEIVVLDIHSPGGYVSSTLELVDMLEAAGDVVIVAYVEREAISGAALLSLAADRIAIGPRALIGDAGMITIGKDAAFRYVPEKERSYLAQRVRTIAEKSGRPPSLAEAMVDKDMLVYKATHKVDRSVRYFNEREWKTREDADQWERGKAVLEAGDRTFFTVNGTRAVELGLADVTVADRDQLAAAIGAIDPIPVLRGSWIDTLIVILNAPIVTALLLIIGLIALVLEFGMPGIGLGGLTAILCFGLFFWARFLGGTAGWFEVSLFVIGLSFIALELLVIPGFGLPGISGAALMLFSLVIASQRMILPESIRDTESLMVDVLTVLGALVGFLVAMIFVSRYLGELPIISRLALAPPSPDDLPPVASLAAPGYSGTLASDDIEPGQLGRTSGPLRPTGRIRIGEHLVDVTTEGDFVDNDVPVKVIARQGSRIVVRQV